MYSFSYLPTCKMNFNLQIKYSQLVFFYKLMHFVTLVKIIYRYNYEIKIGLKSLTNFGIYV